MLIYGAGGHGRVVLSAAQACQQDVFSFFDDGDFSTASHGKIPIRPYDPDFLASLPVVIAVGHNAIRENLSQRIQHPFTSLVHPSAILDSTAYIGEGTVLLPRTTVQPHVRIGKHVIINTSAIIEHDCVLEDFVHVAPGAILCGGVHVGHGTLIGAGAIVVPGIKIGSNCKICAGAVVTRPIPDHSIVRPSSAQVCRSVKS